MNGFLIAIHILTCFFIIFAVLLQVGKGAELGAAFGSMGQSQSARSQQTVMAKFTTVMAILFMLTSAFLTWQTSAGKQSSVIDQIEQNQPIAPMTQPMSAEPAAPEAPAATPPAPTSEPAPAAQ
ncbi:MAG: preprotein translocase subunit SecG [bacterium]|nr:preprotein translocase subunit SecG [bacterium]